MRIHDILHFRTGMHGAFIVASVEGVQVKAGNWLRTPEADVGAVSTVSASRGRGLGLCSLGSVSRNGHIIGHSHALHAARPYCPIRIGDVFNMSEEADRVSHVETRNLPWLQSARKMVLTLRFRDQARGPEPLTALHCWR